MSLTLRNIKHAEFAYQHDQIHVDSVVKGFGHSIFHQSFLRQNFQSVTENQNNKQTNNSEIRHLVVILFVLRTITSFCNLAYRCRSKTNASRVLELRQKNNYRPGMIIFKMRNYISISLFVGQSLLHSVVPFFCLSNFLSVCPSIDISHAFS